MLQGYKPESRSIKNTGKRGQSGDENRNNEVSGTRGSFLYGDVIKGTTDCTAISAPTKGYKKGCKIA